MSETTAASAAAPGGASGEATAAVPAALVVLLLLNGAAGLGYWLWQLPAEHALEAVEVHVLALVRWWQAGLLPYVATDDIPLLQNPYGPLYQALCALLPGTGYLTGRLVSLLSLLAALAMIGTAVRRDAGGRCLAQGGARRLAVACALLPLTAKPILLFAPLYRVDTLGACLSLAGFLWLRRSRGARDDLVGAALCLLAFLTKLTFVAAPLACLLARALRDRRGALRLGLLLLPLPASVLLLEWLTGGHYLASAALGNLPSHPGKGLDTLVRPGLSLFWLVAAVAAWRGTRGEGESTSATTFYVAACLATAALFATNPLSSWNYLIEFYFALALWTGEVLGRARPRALLRRSLLAHALLALPLTAYWLADARHDAARHARRVEIARACLGGDISPGDRIAVFASQAVRDLVNHRGALNALHVPESTERRPEILERIRAGLARGEVDRVVTAGDLSDCGLGHE